MVIRAFSLVVVLLLGSAPAALAEPIKLQPRLVVGDAMHFTENVHTSLSGAAFGTRASDYSFGVTMAVEDIQDDGSATVHETIDSFESSGELSETRLPDLVGTEYTFTLHPDGSVTDLQATNADDSPSPLNRGSDLSFLGTLPQDGLEIGKSYEASSSMLSSLVGVDAAAMPVRTTLEALVIEQDRPAARVVQAVKIPPTEVPYGPFGAAGTVKLSGDAKSTAFFALDTHWPLRQEMTTNYTISFQHEGKQQSVSGQVALSMVMDDESLNDAGAAALMSGAASL